MDKQDFAKGWNRLKSVYDRMPSLTKEVGDEWLRIFEHFTADVFDLGIGEYIANEQYKPTPNQLLHYCIKIASEIKQKRLESTKVEREGCPYCNGAGWWRAKDYYRYPSGATEDCVFPCKCNENHAEAGIRVLNAALADDLWKWDAKERAFIRRGWVGEDKPSRVVSDAVKQAFQNNGVAALFEGVRE